MKYYCNPINVDYKYQFNKEGEKITVSREAADPSMILFDGKYYIFASMTLSVWVSEDMANWELFKLPTELPLYDYAPDARVIGEYVYFSASRRGENCDFYRTKDIIKGPYEKIDGTFEFWDPNLFQDEDGRVYFYWGCSNVTPIFGCELDPVSMKPKGEIIELISGNQTEVGFERIGNDHDSESIMAEKELKFKNYLQMSNMSIENLDNLPAEMQTIAKSFLSDNPFVEGAWMDKHNGKYYLQYSAPGTQYNVYADGVYVSDSPLGPFKLAKNNPYSYKPGGFINGAGHGSTMRDRYNNLWHTSTMAISINHTFERRVGIWPSGFDANGELFCNQRYGDWPVAVENIEMNPWKNPEWYLLSYGKKVSSSQFTEGHNPENIVDENILTWWTGESAEPNQWVEIDLGQNSDVYAIQVNFADDKISIPIPGDIHKNASGERYIEESELSTRWILEGSTDGVNYQVLEDKSQVNTNLPHDLIVKEDGIQIRYIRLTILEVPYQQQPSISGLRVFGVCEGEAPIVPEFKVEKVSDLDMMVTINQSNDDVVGYNILWGHSPEALYHSYMIYGKNSQNIGALVKGENYFVRVDAFNGAGITEGKVTAL